MKDQITLPWGIRKAKVNTSFNAGHRPLIQKHPSAAKHQLDKSIQRAYESLLEAVFPHWKGGSEWRVKLGQRVHYLCQDGFCDADKKVIWVSERIAYDDQELRLMLAHEIVHAIIGPGHGQEFCQRLADAAQMAKHKGDHQLAYDLQDEQELYENTPAVRAENVYGLVRGWAMQAPSFEAAALSVAQDCGLTVEALRQKYPRLRTEWDNARKLYGLCKAFLIDRGR